MAGNMWLADDDDVPPESAREPASWQRWVALVAVFALGVVVALVVADARRDAAGSASVEFLSGGSSLADVVSAGGGAESIDFYLINIGTQEAEILSIDTDGFAADRSAAEPKATTAAPDEWVTFSTELVPDCDVRPSGVLNVTARGGAGEQTLHPKLAPGAFDDAIAFWNRTCRSLREIEVSVELERAVIGGQLTTVLNLSQTSARPSVDLLELDSRTQGISLEIDDDALPVAIANSGPQTELTVRWTITECESAVVMPSVGIDAFISASGGGVERVEVAADTPLSVELARLSERVCET